ncbi:hypothetical protein Hamer_G009845 [Homarus americanus]|uniref:Uncharacterized protein n=1 Tax=Homarus americanus TaxID=6706 RepID=A0A8J5NA21_HOMAM|nr:hypothetical protein Hamer_G009845 [Homarus americanus]
MVEPWTLVWVDRGCGWSPWKTLRAALVHLRPSLCRSLSSRHLTRAPHFPRPRFPRCSLPWDPLDSLASRHREGAPLGTIESRHPARAPIIHSDNPLGSPLLHNWWPVSLKTFP